MAFAFLRSRQEWYLSFISADPPDCPLLYYPHFAAHPLSTVQQMILALDNLDIHPLLADFKGVGPVTCTVLPCL